MYNGTFRAIAFQCALIIGLAREVETMDTEPIFRNTLSSEKNLHGAYNPMPKCYRAFASMVAGLILVSSFGSQISAAQTGQADREVVRELRSISSALQKRPDASAPDRGCRYGEEKRGSDLCAQWKAADAAADSAKWALWTMWLAVVGMAVGGGTLIAAWRAAHWAKKAADHTEIGAKAARDTVSNARGWILPERPQVAFITNSRDSNGVALTNSIGFVLNWKNFGQSPCIEAKQYWDKRVFGIGAIAPEFLVSDLSAQSAVIAPSGNVNTDVLTLTDAETALFRAQKITVFLFAFITYKDIFQDNDSEARQSRVCFRARHDGGSVEQNGRSTEAINFVVEHQMAK